MMQVSLVFPCFDFVAYINFIFTNYIINNIPYLFETPFSDTAQ